MGGRPDITFAENLLLNLVSIISSYKSIHQNLLQIFVGEEKQQNLMKHPKLESGTHGHQEDGHVQHC